MGSALTRPVASGTLANTVYCGARSRTELWGL